MKRLTLFILVGILLGGCNPKDMEKEEIGKKENSSTEIQNEDIKEEDNKEESVSSDETSTLDLKDDDKEGGDKELGKENSKKPKENFKVSEKKTDKKQESRVDKNKKDNKKIDKDKSIENSRDTAKKPSKSKVSNKPNKSTETNKTEKPIVTNKESKEERPVQSTKPNKDTIKKEIVEESIEIPFKTIKKKSSKLYIGETSQRKGQNGQKTLVYEIIYKNGKESSRKLISEKISKDPKNKIIYEGTKVKQQVENKPNPPKEKPSQSHVSNILTQADKNTILNEINAIRSSKGLTPYTYNHNYQNIADKHNLQSSKNNNLNHDNNWMASNNIRRENIGYGDNGYFSTKLISDMWVGSPGHYKLYTDPTSNGSITLSIHRNEKTGITLWKLILLK